MMAPPVRKFDLENGSDVLYFEKFLDAKEACIYFESLNNKIPWIRPTLSVYGRRCEQPRETCYVADEGLPAYKYSGYEPVVYNWDDFPTVKSILNAVHMALPGCVFNTVLINRYTSGTDYAAWHADDEKVYGPTPTIASVTLGKEREFLIRKKKSKKGTTKCENEGMSSSHFVKSAQTGELNSTGAFNAFDVLLGKQRPQPNQSKRKQCIPSADVKLIDPSAVKKRPELYSFTLNNGSLLVMRGNMQRDWEHSIPRRKRVGGIRINLTFRYIVKEASQA